jgi:hypothetical protein
MARVLLLDTNIAAGPLLGALQSLGHEVTLAGGNPSDTLTRPAPRSRTGGPCPASTAPS